MVQIVMRVNTDCMRVKIKCERDNYIFTREIKRHKSEGATSRVTGKNERCSWC